MASLEGRKGTEAFAKTQMSSKTRIVRKWSTSLRLWGLPRGIEGAGKDHGREMALI